MKFSTKLLSLSLLFSVPAIFAMDNGAPVAAENPLSETMQLNNELAELKIKEADIQKKLDEKGYSQEMATKKETICASILANRANKNKRKKRRNEIQKVDDIRKTQDAELKITEFYYADNIKKQQHLDKVDFSRITPKGWFSKLIGR